MIQTKRPIMVLVSLSILLLPAVFSFLNIPVEISPSLEELPTLEVTCSWQGAGPELVARELTTLLEEEAAKVKHVHKIKSHSRRDYSQVVIEFDKKADMKFARFELSERLSSIKRDLPEGIRAPQISTWVSERHKRRKSFLSMTFYGDYDLRELRRIVTENIIVPVRSVEGVASAVVYGGRDLEIVIELNPRLLEHYRISMHSVSAAILQRNQRHMPGRLLHEGTKLYLKMEGAITNLKDIEEIEVGRFAANPVKIADLGVIEVLGKEIYSISRTNGKSTLSMEVERERGTNAIQVSERVKEKVSQVFQKIPHNLSFKIVQDEGEKANAEINRLLRRVGLIIVIIMILLIILLRKKRTFVIIITSVVLTESATFNLLYFTGVSVNFVTLAALAIGLGIVIDNSIVILENIFQKREQGVGLEKSVIEGTREMIRPVLASTLTTLGVFLPFVFFSGRLQETYVPLAIALVYSLGCSLIISFLYVPAISMLMLKDVGRRGFRRNIFGLYRRFTRWTLDNRQVVTLVIVLIGIYSIMVFSEVDRGKWGGYMPKEQLSVGIRLPRGSEMGRADEIARKFEKLFVGVTGVKVVSTMVSREYASVGVDFTDKGYFSGVPYTLKSNAGALASQHAGVSVYIYGFGEPIYTGGIMHHYAGNNKIMLKGYNLDELKSLADDIAKRITSHVRVRSVDRTTAEGMWRTSLDELVMRFRREKVAVDGLSINEVLGQVSSGLGLDRPSDTVLIDGKRLDVRVKEKGAGRRQLEDLKRKIAVFGGGKVGRLGDYFDTSWEKAQDEIYRENQQYQLTLAWEFRGPSKAGEKYYDSIYKSISLPAGYTAEKKDWSWGYMTSEERLEILKVLLASLAIIFMILASLYESFIQPFVIFFSIPLALVGVFLIFYWTGSSFDSSAYIGVVLLSGMVVNNAIIMVDRYNVLIKGGMKLKEALIEGTFSRIRPIVLTTTTTIGGLLPLVIATKQGYQDMWYNLALSTIGGLLSSALFTITLLPIVFMFFEKVRNFIKSKKSMYSLIWQTGGKK